MKFNHKKIEEKWQKYWEEHDFFKAKKDSEKPKFYCLDMFPYPSGKGLHVGHVEGYTATDIISRYKRMNGFSVLHPMGWDAFGLPAENYALKTGVKPQISTKKNIETFKNQLKSIGFSYDWSREINTTDPDYYKWTQWIFTQLYKNDLAYQADVPINWCPSCKTGLANEEVIQGKCERCDSEVERKRIRQWMLKITSYADRLLEDLEELDWPEEIKEMQRNWIGRSEGADIYFDVKQINKEIEVFTTRPDTLFGATFMVLAPEHPIVDNILEGEVEVENKKEIEKYVEQAQKKSELQRTELNKEKTGVEIKGLTAINPVNDKEIPIWIADYVLGSYGYGAIMSVPAHDERDYEIAQKYDLPIVEVIKGGDIEEEAYSGEGELVNSGEFNGMDSEKARKEITEKLKEKGKGDKSVNYKLRDWVFSRQRYWGEPIPIIHCPKCGTVPVPEEDLPLELPDIEKYEPTGTAQSPLAEVEDWVNTTCPECGEDAKRETNTMPQWAGSCWYYLRYLNPKNKEELVGKEKEDYWMPVDLYVGGAEHAVLHLLYSRFWHKFLYDIDVVSTKEPFKKLKNQGLILAESGKKMSKSKGNVVNPNDIVEEYGADVLRLYEMFMGPFEEEVVWNKDSIIGARRFLEKVMDQLEKVEEGIENKELKELTHRTIKKVTSDIDSFKFNTAISSMMILTNEMKKAGKIPQKYYESLIKMLSPFAPHFCEEVWERLGHDKSIQLADWPEYDEEIAKKEVVEIIVQIDGKMRDKFEAEVGTKEEKIKKLAQEREKVKKWLKGKDIKKAIFVQDKLINFVVA